MTSDSLERAELPYRPFLLRYVRSFWRGEQKFMVFEPILTEAMRAEEEADRQAEAESNRARRSASSEIDC